MHTIYVATNTVNGKHYVGQTIQSLGRRWGLHRSRANKNYPHHLYQSIRKYGPEAFELEIVGQVERRSSADALEKLWISNLNSICPEYGYNNTYGGEGGYKTAEGIEKQRQKMLGRKLTPEQRARQGASIKEAWRTGVMTGNRGTKLPESMREKTRIRMTGELSPNYRHDLSNEEIINLFKEGYSYAEIAKKLSCYVDTISRRLKKLGFKTPENWRKKKHGPVTATRI